MATTNETKAGAAPAPVLPGEPVDLVFAGRRQGTVAAKTINAFCVLKDGKAGTELWYPAGRQKLVVGGIYRGARLVAETKQGYGLDALRWVGLYKEDPVAVVGWEARDDEYATTKAHEKLLRDHKTFVEVELRLLRGMLANLHKRGAHAEAAALRTMVVNELYRPLSASERKEGGEQ